MSASSHVAVLTSSLSQALGNVVVSLKTRGESQAHRPDKMTREVTRSLRLRPRGAIARDVLQLAALSLRLRVEWRAREAHPWNHDLSTRRQAQLFARQCLKDVDAAIMRLFERVPEMQVLEIVVRAPRSEAVLMSGVVHRDDFREASHLALQMKLRTIGIKYQLFDCRLEAVFLPDGVHKAVAGL